MTESPSSQPDEQTQQEEEYALQRWIESIIRAGEGIATYTGLVVEMDYRRGILIPDITAGKLTEEQRAEIERWQRAFPHLDIRFHR